jgi:hypothetical protein
MKKAEYYARLTIICLIAVAPLICLLISGYKKSYSAYWETESQPIFIIANVITAYLLNQYKDWQPSAWLLLGVTAFNSFDYRIIHDVIAIMFFVSCLFTLVKKGRHLPITLMFIGSLTILPISILFSEMVAIFALCFYHSLNLDIYYNLTNGKENT